MAVRAEFKKIFSIISGAFIGQLLLFLAYGYGLNLYPVILGQISNAVGLFILISLICDFGGGFYLKQNYENETKTHAFLTIRLIINFICSVAILIISFFVQDEFISEFLFYISPFIFFNSLNVNSLLDVTSEKSWFNIISSMHLCYTAIFIFFRNESAMYLAIGISFFYTSYSIVTFIVSGLKISCFFKFELLNQHKYVFIESLKICVVLLPGQLIPRLLSLIIYTGFSEIYAAVYNFLKTSQNIFNQVVTLVRRVAFAPMKLLYLERGFYLKSVFSVGVSQFFLFISLFFMVVFFFLVPLLYQPVSIYDSMAFIFQSLTWYLISTYIFYLQCLGNNNIPATYSFFIMLFFVTFLVFFEFSNLVSIVIFEAFCSILALFSTLIWSKFFNGNNNS
ncbi:hypothetical protein [Shewanella litoralis]|uniref:Polysaccharide biosynthesis protein n=1 Tax=Shewanella litoralis TaxID=2282700 RepID=A0ABQ2R6Q7_9GAMM|nr:hypothetical protein [Shewanella litoralis]GGQ16704.1 hypothetical protein GCM10009411_16230 [Shewanella litoralis]